ncbi:MAG: hypothetical protein KC431_31480, partial [Myxococcales bacterium]|nr:hypothetical protein [Myxococcales bacterium]
MHDESDPRAAASTFEAQLDEPDEPDMGAASTLEPASATHATVGDDELEEETLARKWLGHYELLGELGRG